MLLVRGAQLVRCCVFWPVHLVVKRLISSQNTEAAYGSFFNWVQGISTILQNCTKITINGDRNAYKRQDRVLLLANHQSWVDILILYAAFKVPLTFIMKSSLRRIPFLGWAFRIFRFPLIERKTTDRSAWKKPILDFIERGVVCPLVLFPEGTRYNQEKARRSKHPHLLNPHVDALQLVLPHYERVIDVTIKYEQTDISVIRLLQGRIKHVQLTVKDVTSNLPAQQTRSSLYRTLNAIWEEKSALLS